MKKLMPILIALLGLGAGLGAGLALKPAPEVAASCAPPEGEAGAPAEAKAGEHGAAPCPEPAAAGVAEEAHGEVAYVPIEKPFVVPIFASEKLVAMVVVSLSVATEGEAGASQVEAVEPRLRDSFLQVMFRHANSGGFDGSFTTGRKMEDLKSALLASAREVMAGETVDEVLITEIARQDS